MCAAPAVDFSASGGESLVFTDNPEICDAVARILSSGAVQRVTVLEGGIAAALEAPMPDAPTTVVDISSSPDPITDIAMRSFMLPVGFRASTLTRILAASGGTTCRSSTSGVFPMHERIEFGRGDDGWAEQQSGKHLFDFLWRSEVSAPDLGLDNPFYYLYLHLELCYPAGTALHQPL